MKYAELVHSSVRPTRAVEAARTSLNAHRAEPEYNPDQNQGFLATALTKRRSRFVVSSRRNFLRGALLTASGAVASAATTVATSVGPAKALARQSDVSASGSYPYRILSTCAAEQGNHNCRPGCGPTPVCNDIGCCGGDGYFRNEPDAGFMYLDSSYCAVRPLLGDGWIWEYYPDLDGADAGGPCSHCNVIVFRCHDGQFYNFDTEVWAPGICRTELSCEPAGGSRLEPTPVPEETAEETPTETPEETETPTPEATPDGTPTPTPEATPTPEPTASSGAVDGHLDSLSDATGGRLTVTGWIRGSESPESITMEVDVDDTRVYGGPANLLRRDVSRIDPEAGDYHGFATTIAGVSAGDHVVCIYGRIDGQRQLLACSDIAIAEGDALEVEAGPSSVTAPSPAASVPSTQRPIGGIDAMRAGAYGGAYASGWAADLDRAGGPYIEATVDGETAAVSTTALPRRDVAEMFPELGPNTGWALEVPYVDEGPHEICIYAVDAHDGRRVLLGCQTVLARPSEADQVASTLPEVADNEVTEIATGVTSTSSDLRIDGGVDSVTASVGTVTVRGWCVDRFHPDKPLRAVVVVNGAEQELERTEARPDIAAALDVPETLGFVGAVATSAGRVTVEVYALSEAGVRLGLLGYETVLVP